MRNPPLCQLWQLYETGPQCVTIERLLDMHEAIDMEEEMLRRQEQDKK